MTCYAVLGRQTGQPLLQNKIAYIWAGKPCPYSSTPCNFVAVPLRQGDNIG